MTPVLVLDQQSYCFFCQTTDCVPVVLGPEGSSGPPGPPGDDCEIPYPGLLGDLGSKGPDGDPGK